MPHNNDETVLQASSDELPIATGPQGDQGQIGAPGINAIAPNILSINAEYTFLPSNPYTPAFVKAIIIEQGTRFKPSAGFIYSTVIANVIDSVIGELINFLVAPTDVFTAHVEIQEVILHSGVIADTASNRIKIEILRTANDSLKWRFIGLNGSPQTLFAIADPLVLNIQKIKFSILITSINT